MTSADDRDDPAACAQSDTLEQFTGALEWLDYAVVVLDGECRIRYVNRACELMVGRSRQRIAGDVATDALPELFGASFLHYREVHGLGQPGAFEEYHGALEMWTESHASPSPCGLLVCARDVSAQKRDERVLAGQARVLEMVAAAAPLGEVLNAITSLVEQQSRQDLCSILLLSNGRLNVAAAASFPAEYNAAIDGVEIGPAAGSCGTAAFTGRLVVASDIAADPRWAGYEQSALRHGLCACWSRPILSRDGQRVVGTVANYSRKPGQPTEQSLRLLETAAHLARIAIGQAEGDAERKLTERLLATEAAVTRVLAAAESAEETLPRLLRAVCTTCDWETGAYWAVDEEAGVIRCATFWRQGDVNVEEFERLSLQTALAPGAGLPGRVWATARPAWITDLREDSNLPRRSVAARLGLRGALGFPVMREGRVLGVMEFFARAIRPPDANLDAMLTVLGGQAGQFLHRVQAEEQLKAAKESAEKANRAKDRFLATLSHELRTPLSPALLIATAMAADPRLPPEVRDDVRTVERNIRLQTRLIDDLLDVSRIENGKLSLQLEPLDLHALLRDGVAMCDADAVSKGVRITLELGAKRHGVHGDPSRLRQVTCNLLKNAIKFTPPGGGITVRTADDAAGDLAGGCIAVAVRDTGVGVEPGLIQKLFDPFEQGGRGRESQGLGLGLTICKGLVEAHGGSISASSDGPGRGMTVTFHLPAMAELPAEAGRPPAPDHAAPHRALRILLVDDHPDTLRAMASLLRRLEHQVITADCVRSALGAAADAKFDLLISDVGLPDGSGTALMRELLKLRPIKGIALTGYGTESDIRQTREAGFFAHLTKPIDFEQLQSAILQGAQSSQAQEG